MDSHQLSRALSRLAGATQGELLTVLYRRGDLEEIEKLLSASQTAGQLLAYMPHDYVVAEADALLYQTLRGPVFDALPPGMALPDTHSIARHLSMTESEAAGLLERILDSECDAARALIASGVDPDWTLEQQQVMKCIEELVERGIAPTRGRVVSAALEHASAAMPRWSTEPPVSEVGDAGLERRINSPSAMALVPGWMSRMDANPPVVQLPQDRIAFLLEARRFSGRACSVAATDLAPAISGRFGTHESPRLGLSA